MPASVPGEDVANRLDEIVINKGFDINAALSAIQFYWNLARHRGETIVVEIWKQQPPKEKPCSSSPSKAVELYKGYSQEM